MEAVALSTATSALNLVVKTAPTAITDKIGLLLGVEEEFFFIKEELDHMMQAFLEAASTEKVKSVHAYGVPHAHKMRVPLLDRLPMYN
ncbi:hypothetical protein FCM35_KLT18920 [Carex littledalei]|uniref:Uncharacterized protein n=1 Tax=Carex littledalei TaxID=544730 RepID=A0A833RKC0_9POAL|nr:hypothetical protein FCM35_KLT18920 [Carex littledalei]